MCSVTKMVTASSTSGIDTAIDIMVFDYTASHIITIAVMPFYLSFLVYKHMEISLKNL